MQEQSRKARALLREQDLLPFPGEHDLANILRYVVTCSIGKDFKKSLLIRLAIISSWLFLPAWCVGVAYIINKNEFT